MTKRLTQTQAEFLVSNWNEQHKVGTEVDYWKGTMDGPPSGRGRTYAAASLMCGAPVLWIQGCSGCIAISHTKIVQPIEVSA